LSGTVFPESPILTLLRIEEEKEAASKPTNNIDVLEEHLRTAPIVLVNGACPKNESRFPSNPQANASDRFRR